MPRIATKKKEYMISDIGAWVILKMKNQKISQCTMATKLKITQQGLSYKLTNNAFTYADLLTIFDELNATDNEVLKIMKVRTK